MHAGWLHRLHLKWPFELQKKLSAPTRTNLLCSIRRNICFGLEDEDGLGPDEQPSTEEIEQAARLANAHDFIMAMPQGYDAVRPLPASTHAA